MKTAPPMRSGLLKINHVQIELADQPPSGSVQLTFDDFRQSELTDNVNLQCKLKEQSELTDKVNLQTNKQTDKQTDRQSPRF